MTISEHLQFSVLTAPLASVDRRSLSQAWYSALYGTGEPPSRQHPSRGKAMDPGKSPPLQRATALKTLRPASIAQPAPSTAMQRPSVAIGPLDRRAPRSVLARKIEQVFLQPKTRLRKAAFELESACGRVQILLNTGGSRVRLIAICPQKARKEVAGALAQARYALASRGIDLSSDIREMAIC